VENIFLSTEVQDFLSIVLVAVLPVLASVLAAGLVSALESVRRSLRLHLRVEQIDALERAAKFAVSSAEQSGLAGLISNLAEEKKKFAVALVQTRLQSIGLDKLAENLEMISAAIEAAVAKEVQERIDFFG